MKTRAGSEIQDGPWAGATGSPWGPNGPTDPDDPEAYFASVPTSRDTPQPYRTSAGGATLTYLAMRVLSKNASVKTHQPQYWNNKVAVNNATDSLTAPWLVSTYFFGTRTIGSYGTYTQGYSVLRSSPDGSEPYALYREKSAVDSTYSYAPLNAPASVITASPVVSITSITDTGTGATISVSFSTTVPSGYYLVVLPNTMSASHAYADQGVAVSVGGLTSKTQAIPVVTGSTLYAFLVDGNPNPSGSALPAVKSNVAWGNV
jgi:hypothetical protein